MKTIFYLLFFTFLLLTINTACQNKVSAIENEYAAITVDTAYTDVKGFVLSSTFHNGKYYVFCGEKLYTMRQNGMLESVENITLLSDHPNGIPDYRIRLRNNKVQIRRLLQEYDFIFDFATREWMKAPADNTIYEDDNYIISRKSYGEFGGFVYFTDKKTGAKYETLCLCDIMANYFQNKYYITSYLPHKSGFSSIIEIDNPHSLSLATPEKIERMEETYLSTYIDENKEQLHSGSRIILDKSEIQIHATFIHKGRLLAIYTVGSPGIYSQENSVYIGAITKGELNPIYTFSPKMHVKYEHQLPDEGQFLSFNTQDGVFGFINITPEKISIHYMLNKKD